MFLGVFFSCFACPDSFWVIPSVSGPVFMFCSPILVFGGTEGLGSRFHVLLARTHFRRYRRRRVPFSCIARSDSFSVIPRASGPVFIFCAAGLVFDGSEGVRSSFHVLCARTRFRRFRGRRVPFSCYPLLDMFLGVPRASGAFFTFCAPDSCSAVTRVSGPVFMFCPPGFVFGGTEVVWSRFQVLRARTCFRRYRGRRVPFSCFLLPDMFLGVPRASGAFFTFCAPRLFFGDTEGVGSRFHALRSWTRFRRYRWRR
jgi:hypothetical protein